MKKLLVVLLVVSILSGCASTKYIEVPAPQTRIEYRDRTSVDTLIQVDSVIIRAKGDTVVLENYKYLYRTKEVRDTVNITDTVTIVKTVEVTKEVNKLHNWQVMLIILGGVMTILKVYSIIKLIKR